MTGLQTTFLQAFLDWATKTQRALVLSPYQSTLSVGSPTATRSAAFELVLHEKKDGWVNDDVVMFGSVRAWESGSVDAEVFTEKDVRENVGPHYAKNWYPLKPSEFDAEFQDFLSYFGLRETADDKACEI